MYTHVLGGFSFRGTDDAAAAPGRNPRVARVDPALPVQLAGEAAPYGILRIDAWRAHQAGYAGTANGTKVRIAVIDSGINAGPACGSSPPTWTGPSA